MDPQVVAAVIAGALTVIGTLAVQYFGRRGVSKDAEKALAEQREQLTETFAEQRAQIDKTLKAQSEQLDRTLAEQRTRTLNERFATAAEQLGSDKPAVRLAGVYAMAGLADDWEENRQTCIDVLCAYLRMPYEPDPGDDAPEPQRLAFNAIREIRHTVIRVITAHLKKDAAVSWQGLNFDFTGAVFDLSWAKLVRTCSTVNAADSLAEVVGQRVGCGDGVWACLDLNGAVTPCGLDELADGPAGGVLDPPADCQGGEHDGQVSFDGVPGPVIDGPGLKVALGHPE